MPQQGLGTRGVTCQVFFFPNVSTSSRERCFPAPCVCGCLCPHSPTLTSLSMQGTLHYRLPTLPHEVTRPPALCLHPAVFMSTSFDSPFDGASPDMFTLFISGQTLLSPCPLSFLPATLPPPLAEAPPPRHATAKQAEMNSYSSFSL